MPSRRKSWSTSRRTTDLCKMLGGRLEVQVDLITGQVTRSKTLLTCVIGAGIEVAEMVFEPLRPRPC